MSPEDRDIHKRIQGISVVRGLNNYLYHSGGSLL